MDANWIEEGFTTYYQAKILYKSGFMSEADLVTFLDNLKEELWQDNKRLRYNLIKSSKKQILGQGDEQDYRIVYYGGALVARYLEEELQKQNKSLDSIWKMLYYHGNPLSTDDFIKILSRFGGKTLSEQCLGMVNGQKLIY